MAVTDSIIGVYILWIMIGFTIGMIIVYFVQTLIEYIPKATLKNI